jgi:hypothetical protein
MSITQRPEFLSFNNNREQSEQTALVIFNRFSNGELCPPKVLDLMEELIQVHLYFFLNGSTDKIVRFSENQNTFMKLEQLGYKYIVCVEPGFLIKSADEAQSLLYEAIANPIIDLIKYKESDFKIQLIKLNVGFGKKIDNFFSKNYNGQLENELSCLKLSKSKDTTSHFIDFSPLTDEQTRRELEEQSHTLKNYLQDGFTSTFVFNTEKYDDINRFDIKIEKVQLIGLASGFKLNYLAHKYHQNCSELLFVDSNENALKLKKDMFEGWDGTNLPDWFFSKWNYQFNIHESNREFFESCWQRELEIWGGASEFKKHWHWFQEQSVKFKKIDLITEIELLLPLINQNNNVIFWNSNLWNNEFVSHALSHRILPHYLNWIHMLQKHNPHIFMIQDHILHKGKKVSFVGKSVDEIQKNSSNC